MHSWRIEHMQVPKVRQVSWGGSMPADDADAARFDRSARITQRQR